MKTKNEANLSFAALSDEQLAAVTGGVVEKVEDGKEPVKEKTNEVKEKVHEVKEKVNEVQEQVEQKLEEVKEQVRRPLCDTCPYPAKTSCPYYQEDPSSCQR